MALLQIRYLLGGVSALKALQVDAHEFGSCFLTVARAHDFLPILTCVSLGPIETP